MLLRSTDPFRDFDRLTQQLLGTTNRPAVMPMDAWREGDHFVIELDVPGVNRESIDLDRIEATYDDGVLRLVVPVAEKAKPRKIEIGTSSDDREKAAIES